eukprot:822273-Pleurochrysis_carterae.AAC.2
MAVMHEQYKWITLRLTQWNGTDSSAIFIFQLIRSSTEGAAKLRESCEHKALPCRPHRQPRVPLNAQHRPHESTLSMQCEEPSAVKAEASRSPWATLAVWSERARATTERGTARTTRRHATTSDVARATT